jgi:hypothetical protein
MKLLTDIQDALGQVRPMVDVGEGKVSPDSVKKINEITTRLDGEIVTR